MKFNKRKVMSLLKHIKLDSKLIQLVMIGVVIITALVLIIGIADYNQKKSVDKNLTVEKYVKERYSDITSINSNKKNEKDKSKSEEKKNENKNVNVNSNSNNNNNNNNNSESNNLDEVKANGKITGLTVERVVDRRYCCAFKKW